MVMISFHELDGVYEEMRKSACDRQGCSMMILVANDVDAMASAKILTHLLRQDNISYKTRPVASLAHVREAAAEVRELDIRTVILLNCGATANIVKLFDLDMGGDLRCIIMDGHRPVHLANVHSRYNVAVLGEEQGQDEGISSGSEYSDNESDSGDEDSDDGAGADDDVPNDGSESESETAEAEFEEGDGDASDGAGSDGDDDGDNEKEDDEDNGFQDQESAAESGEEGTDGDGGRRVRRRLNDDGEDVEEPTAEGDPEEVDSDEDVVIGRRRSTLAAAFDPRVRRRKLLRQYYNKVSTNDTPTAVMLIPLVKLLNRPCTQDLLWQAVVGVTDHFLRSNISDEFYESVCEAIKRELPDDNRRFRIGEGAEEMLVPGAEAGVVTAGLDYSFFLYRHWSLYDSMTYSDYMCAKLSSYKSKGAAKLQELLARMGVPLHQCKQNYSFMAPELRAHFRKELLGPVSAEFGLADPPPLFKSFYRYNAFKNPVAAADVVFAVSALIESAGLPTSLLASGSHKDALASDSPSGVGDLVGSSGTKGSEADDLMDNAKTWIQAFNDGYDCLSMRPESDDLLKQGITSAINLQKAIVGQGTAMLDGDGAILNLKTFRVGYIYRASHGLSDSHTPAHSGGDGKAKAPETEMVFTRPLVLIRLAQFLLKIQNENGQWAGKRAKPLLLAAEKASDSFIVLGVSAKGSSRTKFKKIFKKIAVENEINFSNDAFEASIIEVDKSGLELFLYKLMKHMNAYFV